MIDVFEEWFKRIELRLKYELPPDYYEKTMAIMLSELKMLYEEESGRQNKKNEKNKNTAAHRDGIKIINDIYTSGIASRLKKMK
jgi:hypothetical protein